MIIKSNRLAKLKGEAKISETHPKPICRLVFEIGKLMEDYPPEIRDRNKKIVFEMAWLPGTTSDGRLIFTRWKAMELPEFFPPEPVADIEFREDGFQYEPAPQGGQALEWYLNFADPHLFAAYGGPLMAQDEIQMAEHPCLAALREALVSLDLPALTVEDGEPTPVLVMGAERRCALDFETYNLYGNNFARAKAEMVRKATRALNPPSKTNIIAMAAPMGGYGRYSLEEIIYIVKTAYTGFRAAHLESARQPGKSPEVVVHPGFWGCGVFGGNKVLMTMLQFLAADLAGVDKLVFHTLNPQGTEAFSRAKNLYEEIAAGREKLKVDKVLHRVEELGFEWGVGDGN